jgi:hypothetical protein
VLHATTLQSDLTKRVSAGNFWDTSIPQALEILETIGFLSHGAQVTIDFVTKNGPKLDVSQHGWFINVYNKKIENHKDERKNV